MKCVDRFMSDITHGRPTNTMNSTTQCTYTINHTCSHKNGFKCLAQLIAKQFSKAYSLEYVLIFEGLYNVYNYRMVSTNEVEYKLHDQVFRYLTT